MKKYPDRWQDCKPFVDTLVDKHGYVSYVMVSGKQKQGLQLCMADGVYLYMYELWQDGIAYGRPLVGKALKAARKKK